MRNLKNLVKLFLLILLTTLVSCKKKTNIIEIKGDIKGLDATWVYLYNNYPIGKKPPLDSARVTNGKFAFNFRPDTVFETNLVYISYKKNNGKPDTFSIINPYTAKNGKQDFYGNLLMETGTTLLTGDFTKNRGITLTGGHQNQFYFAHIGLPFITISTDPAKHDARVKQFISDLQDTPDAWWAMFALRNLKYQLTNADLKQIYNAFDEQTRRSYSGKKLKEFFTIRPDKNAPRPNNHLLTLQGTHAVMIDTTKKLNMIIFWASWCGPCRAEIPALKKVAAKINDDQFRMVSVSIDEDKALWQTAAKEESMPWQQLAIDQNLLDRLKIQYNLNFIPQIFFIDNNRKLLAKLGGFDPKNEDEIMTIINKCLK